MLTCSCASESKCLFSEVNLYLIENNIENVQIGLFENQSRQSAKLVCVCGDPELAVSSSSAALRSSSAWWKGLQFPLKKHRGSKVLGRHLGCLWGLTELSGAEKLFVFSHKQCKTALFVAGRRSELVSHLNAFSLVRTSMCTLCVSSSVFVVVTIKGRPRGAGARLEDGLSGERSKVFLERVLAERESSCFRSWLTSKCTCKDSPWWGSAGGLKTAWIADRWPLFRPRMICFQEAAWNCGSADRRWESRRSVGTRFCLNARETGSEENPPMTFRSTCTNTKHLCLDFFEIRWKSNIIIV